MLFSKIRRSAADPRPPSVRVSQVDLTGEGMSDDVLLAGFGAKDPRLAEAFVRRFQRMVFGIALAVVGDTEMAEEIAQQTFEHACRCADTYDVRCGPVRTWLMRITHNLTVDAARIRRTVPVDPDGSRQLVDSPVTGRGQPAPGRPSTIQLRRSLARLPSGQARAVVMAAVHGMSAREIADIEGIPLGTARSRIRAGMTQLQSLPPANRDDHE
jgi:RNA polymerase sigma factor (sigma-70 family)